MSHSTRSLPSFSLRTLLLLVTFVSMAVATTASASEQVHDGLMIAAVLLPTLAIPLAIYFDGGRRAFWIGVAAFGIWTLHLMHPPSHSISSIHRWFEPAVTNLVGDPIADLHWKRAEGMAYDRFRKSNPSLSGLTVEQIKTQFPQRWTEAVAIQRNNMKARPAYLAWDNLQLALSLLGGVLTYWAYHLRENASGMAGAHCA